MMQKPSHPNIQRARKRLALPGSSFQSMSGKSARPTGLVAELQKPVGDALPAVFEAGLVLVAIHVDGVGSLHDRIILLAVEDLPVVAVLAGVDAILTRLEAIGGGALGVEDTDDAALADFFV